MIRLRTNQDGPALDESVDVPERVQNAAEAALEADEAGLIPDECGTGTGQRRAEMLADNDVTVADFLTRNNDMTPIPAYLNSHEEDATTDDPPTEWSDEQWQDCGDVGLARWGWYVDWFTEKANELAEARGEEQPYTANMATYRVTTEPTIRLRTNAKHWEEGDVVSTPDGLGIVVEVREEDFEGPGGASVSASEDSPKYVVGLEDKDIGAEVYTGTELREGELPETDVEDPVEDLDESPTANAAKDLTANQWDPPESWEESDTPARLIALDAWASMGGQFDCGGACCMGTMRPELGEGGAAEFCGSFKDFILGGWEGWRRGG